MSASSQLPYTKDEWRKKPWRGIPVCEHCGSVLSPVTWECVRGPNCPGPKKQFQQQEPSNG